MRPTWMNNGRLIGTMKNSLLTQQGCPYRSKQKDVRWHIFLFDSIILHHSNLLFNHPSQYPETHLSTLHFRFQKNINNPVHCLGFDS